MPVYDLAIVGGGINGAGVAREAALRGYSVLLLEQADWAAGTSSQSSKLIHGGIRYLATGDFHLVKESLAERKALLRMAPHLVTPLELVIPVRRGQGRPLWQWRLGTWLYDWLAGRKNLGRSRRVKAKELAALPGGVGQGVVGAVAYYDAQTDDARLVLETVLSAQEKGAVVHSYHPVEKVAPLPEGKGYRLQGHQALSEEAFEFEARVVLNATGPWVPQTESRWLPAQPAPQMVYSRGIHLVLPHVGLTQGVVMAGPEPKGQERIVFALPWRGRFTLVGTTDTPFEGPFGTSGQSSAPSLEAPGHSEEEVAYLLEVWNRHFVDQSMTEADVHFIHSGVRALAKSHELSLSRLSREASVEVWPQPGGGAWAVVYGGKLTSYRALAEQVITELTPCLGAPPQPLAVGASAEIPLWGAAPQATEPHPSAVSVELQQAWQQRYGTRWVMLAQAVQKKPALAEILLQRYAYSKADLAHMIMVEQAKTLDDILLRRTRMGYDLNQEEQALMQSAWNAMKESL